MAAGCCGTDGWRTIELRCIAIWNMSNMWNMSMGGLVLKEEGMGGVSGGGVDERGWLLVGTHLSPLE